MKLNIKQCDSYKKCRGLKDTGIGLIKLKDGRVYKLEGFLYDAESVEEAENHYLKNIPELIWLLKKLNLKFSTNLPELIHLSSSNPIVHLTKFNGNSLNIYRIN